MSNASKIHVVIVIDHSPDMRVGECFKMYFRMKLPNVEVHTAPTVADYTTARELAISCGHHIFLVIWDWPMPHQVEDLEDEERATIEELWASSLTQSIRKNYMYPVLPSEEVEKRMRAYTKVAGAATRPLPYAYYSMGGGDLKILLEHAKDAWLTSSGHFARA